MTLFWMQDPVGFSIGFIWRVHCVGSRFEKPLNLCRIKTLEILSAAPRKLDVLLILLCV